MSTKNTKSLKFTYLDIVALRLELCKEFPENAPKIYEVVDKFLYERERCAEFIKAQINAVRVVKK